MSGRPRQVPKKYQARLAEIVEMMDAFCTTHLNEEYREVCRAMAEAVCQNGSPVRSGKASGWASGIVYSVGWVNFLSDPTQTPHMTGLEIAKGFGVSESTLMAKSRILRRGLDLIPLDPSWTIPSRMDDNPMVWMMEVNGFIVDVRNAPHELQKRAFEAGRIPYIPADRAQTASGGTRS